MKPDTDFGWVQTQFRLGDKKKIYAEIDFNPRRITLEARAFPSEPSRLINLYKNYKNILCWPTYFLIE